MDFFQTAFKVAASVPLRTYALGVGAISVSTIIWEHTGRKKTWTYRPSVGLEKTAVVSKNFYEAAGKKIAWLSSYLTQIDLKDLGETLVAVGKPTCDIFASPFRFFYGYYVQAKSYLNKEWMVYTGSALLAVLLAFSWYYLSTMYPKLNFWTTSCHYLSKYISRQ